MLRSLIAAAIALAVLSTFATPAEARPRRAPVSYIAHPDCNVIFPCEGVVASTRGQRVVKAMGGFGSAQKIYKPRTATVRSKKISSRHQRVPVQRVASVERPYYGAPSPSIGYSVGKVAAQVIGGRPPGCPHAFCGCGASLHLFGRIIPELNLAANWLRKFPRTTPAPGMAAARRGHVFVLEQHIQGDVWLVHDSNSGGHRTRLHARSIAGYQVVNPHG